MDLTKNWTFNGGSSVEDIYRRLRTGLDGTPMPSFSDLLDAGFMTDDQLWSLAHFVRSLAPEDEPTVQEVIVAGQVLPGRGSHASHRRELGWRGVVLRSPGWTDY